MLMIVVECSLLDCHLISYWQKNGPQIVLFILKDDRATAKNILKRGCGYKALQSLLCCHFFQKCSNLFIFWYCGRNVCFSKMPKFQDPTQPPSYQNRADGSRLKCQLTHENINTKVIWKNEKGAGLQFRLILYLLIQE